jgi:hypothetical protein
MARFLVEAYAPNADAIDPVEAIGRLEAAAEELSAAGPTVRHLHVIVVPGDETCFHVFEGPSVEVVEEVGRRARVAFDRVTEALEPVPSKGASG